MAAPGGLSKDTQKLVERMMKQSKISNLQQRELRSQISQTGSLPNKCTPILPHTAKAQEQKKRSSKPRQPKITGMTTRRTQDEILRSTGNYREEAYRPSPTKNLALEKRKLQNKMMFGNSAGVDIEAEKRKARAKALRDAQPKLSDDVDEFQMLVEEINDRHEFLRDMEAMGQAKKYEAKIRGEISQRIARMELIDKQRTAQAKAQLASTS